MLSINVGYKKVILRTVDVVVLAVAATEEIDIKELWVALWRGRHFRYIPRRGLLHPLALTSLDLFLYLITKGNKSAWETAESI